MNSLRFPVRRLRMTVTGRVFVLLLLFVAGCWTDASRDSSNPLSEAERKWLRDKGTILFVSQTSYPPFEFIGKHDNPQGMCLELVQWMSAELGFKASFRNMPFEEAQEAVLSGEVDVLTSLFYSTARDERFDFTDLTWEVPALIFVRTERPDITGTLDLRGKRIAMQRGDFAADFLKDRQIPYDQVPTDSFAEAADRVISGQADAVIGDQQIVLFHLFSKKLSDQLKSVGKPLYIGSNRMAVREGQAELVVILNKGLALARERGVFDTITRKWVGTQYTQQAAWPHRYAKHLAIALVVVASLAALVIVWGVRLRRMVARRTRELMESRDAFRPVSRASLDRRILRKWIWVLAGLIPLGLGAEYALRNFLIMPRFYAIEKQESEAALSACIDAIRREQHHLGQIAADWAIWDDTYRFVQDVNQSYVQSNLQWEGLVNSGINLITILDLEGRVVWSGAYDPDEEAQITIEGFPTGSLPLDHPLLRHGPEGDKADGILLTDRGPLLLTAQPILTSTGEGPARGYFVMGRFLRDGTVRALSRQTRVVFGLISRHAAELDETRRVLMETLPPGALKLEVAGNELLMGYSVLADLNGDPALLVSAEIPRKIVQQGRGIARIASMILLSSIAVIGLLLLVWSILFMAEAFQRQAHIEALVEQRTAKLQESETKFRELTDLLPQTVFETDLQGNLTYANQVAFKAFGYSEEEFAAGLNAIQMMIAEDRPRAMDNFARTISGENEGTPPREYTALRKDGATFPIIMYSNPIRRDGKALGIRGIIFDISERQRLVEEKARLEEQFQQSQKVEAIGRLAGGVAHDLNNLLSPILGYSELLLRDFSPMDTRRTQVEQIMHAGLRSRDLVRQLLAFSRKQTLEYKSMDLNLVIAKFAKLLRRTIREDIDIKVLPSSEIRYVNADIGQIEQVIMNLAVNAQDAMPDGGRLTIETSAVRLDESYAAVHAGVQPGDYVMLAISDTGNGMAEEIRKHIFEPFFSTKGEMGTGLGLATVYGIVKQHGGNIWVYSEPGKGTTFKIYLPVADKVQGEEHNHKNPVSDLKGWETVLLVEDNDQVRELAEAILERQGYHVLLSRGSQEALDLLKTYQGPLHLLLTDVVMPGLNGKQLYQRVVEQYPDLRVLYMSGYPENVIAHRGVLDENVDFVQKPFSVMSLTVKVREVLDAERRVTV